MGADFAASAGEEGRQIFLCQLWDISVNRHSRPAEFHTVISVGVDLI
jgi:hypothetical protein